VYVVWEQPPETFVNGYKAERGFPDVSSPVAAASNIKISYWHPVSKSWWRVEAPWKAVDHNLPAIEGPQKFVTQVYSEILEGWTFLKAPYPNAIWDPYSWRWFVAEDPTEHGPGGANDRDTASRIARVNKYYLDGAITAQVRDERIAEILRAAGL
jgi:hypothetical protein